MSELKTVKEALADMKKFMDGGAPQHVTDSKQFGQTIVKVLESLNYKIEELERQIGPSGAFIDPNDSPHRLR